MVKYKSELFSLFIFLLGMVLAFVVISNSTAMMEGTAMPRVNVDEILERFDPGAYPFITILVNNLLVALLILGLGFITGGAGALIILFFNGYLFGLICVLGLSSMDPFTFVIKLLHGPTEIFAFILCSAMALRGFRFYRALLEKQVFQTHLIPNKKELLLPIILIVCSALIESICLKY
ncbi:MAG: stage II sporulation protein M [Bacteroidota bacterium]